MGSQRVKLLTAGYLRGWLDFKYPQQTSRVRELVVLAHLEEERVQSAMERKLLVDTAIRASLLPVARNVDVLDPVFETLNTLLGMQLPSYAAKDKIEETKKTNTIDEWKTWLESVNKKNVKE